MALSITSLRENQGDSTFYDEDFRRMIEEHRIYLQNAEGTDWRDITAADAWRWRYDFYGLLKYLDIPEHLRWIYLRCNDLMSTEEYDGLRTTIMIPSYTAIQSLSAIFTNQYRTG